MSSISSLIMKCLRAHPHTANRITAIPRVSGSTLMLNGENYGFATVAHASAFGGAGTLTGQGIYVYLGTTFALGDAVEAPGTLTMDGALVTGGNVVAAVAESVGYSKGMPMQLRPA